MKSAVIEGFCMNAAITAMFRKMNMTVESKIFGKMRDRKKSLQLERNCNRNEITEIQTGVWEFSTRRNHKCH